MPDICDLSRMSQTGELSIVLMLTGAFIAFVIAANWWNYRDGMKALDRMYK